MPERLHGDGGHTIKAPFLSIYELVTVFMCVYTLKARLRCQRMADPLLFFFFGDNLELHGDKSAL